MDDQLRGQKYVGKVHKKCGTDIKYVSNNACVHCTIMSAEARAQSHERAERKRDRDRRLKIALRLFEAW